MGGKESDVGMAERLSITGGPHDFIAGPPVPEIQAPEDGLLAEMSAFIVRGAGYPETAEWGRRSRPMRRGPAR
ncbi:hypothetical protein [Mycobacterium branderi]|uniref:Uncharacterized protein n=1 Tax=Mycobacterium branderi TaxID=43348 RepID=A0ABM7KV24_9MYCO|nr:hypothetical protein [Mycobacterium branderi]BBZ14932.1 hypothetical protein MBRA_51270 [Mycobacterium branderi]